MTSQVFYHRATVTGLTKKLAEDKRSSLFCPAVIDKDELKLVISLADINNLFSYNI
jgi:hypothetical protein